MFRISMVVAAAFLSTGCASIVSGQNQSLSVTTKNQGADVSGAKCSLTNDKGTWYATTPASVTVRRSFNDLAVNCTLEGAEPGIASVKSTTKGMAFGNIIFGGIIGAGVDMSTGAAYDYPDIINVELGKVVSLAPIEAQAKDAAPTAVAASPQPVAATPEKK